MKNQMTDEQAIQKINDLLTFYRSKKQTQEIKDKIAFLTETLSMIKYINYFEKQK